MEQINRFFNEITAKMNALDTAKRLYGQQLAPEFHVFDYIDTSENGLSWLIANLLDPNGKHGQRTLFLENFVEVCLPHLHHSEQWQPFMSHMATATVVTENLNFASNTKRRMDIYVSVSTDNATEYTAQSYGICIENKPYASDQINQMRDYEKEMRTRHQDNFHLVYLNEYAEPADTSVSAEVLEEWKTNRLISIVTYSQLVKWLNACKAGCQNHSVSEFVNQFIKFIQKRFMGVEDMNEQEMMLETMMSSTNNVVTSIKVALSTEVMKEKLIRKLLEDLRALIKCSEKYIRINCDVLHATKKFEKIKFESLNSNYIICLEFKGSWFNMPVLGILNSEQELSYSNSQKIKLLEDVQTTLSDKIIKSDEKWCFYYNFEPWNWWSNTQPWEMIHTGEMARKIIAEVEVLNDVLQANPAV